MDFKLLILKHSNETNPQDEHTVIDKRGGGEGSLKLFFTRNDLTSLFPEKKTNTLDKLENSSPGVANPLPAGIFLPLKTFFNAL